MKLCIQYYYVMLDMYYHQRTMSSNNHYFMDRTCTTNYSGRYAFPSFYRIRSRVQRILLVCNRQTRAATDSVSASIYSHTLCISFPLWLPKTDLKWMSRPYIWYLHMHSVMGDTETIYYFRFYASMDFYMKYSKLRIVNIYNSCSIYWLLS